VCVCVCDSLLFLIVATIINKDGKQCDLHQPKCFRCLRNHRDCIYEDPSAWDDALHDAGPSLSLVQPSAAAAASSLASMAGMEGSIPGRAGEHSTSIGHLLHHFSNNSVIVMGQPFDPKLWDLACRHEFLLSTVVAASACHLRHHSANQAPHHTAELHQVLVVIRALKSTLALPLDKEHADAVLCAAIMLNGINFTSSVNSQAASASWVFSDSPDRLDWLDLQLGFRKLEEATSQFLESSILRPLMNAAGHGPVTDRSDAMISLNQVPTAWRMLIGDDYHSYDGPVRMLAELRTSEPLRSNALKYFGFVNRLGDGFRDLLFQRNRRAMWVFGYWLGLMGRLDIWWCSRRVEQDWNAVVLFLQRDGLQQRPGDEGWMWQELIADLSTASEWPLPPSVTTENSLAMG